MGRLTLIVLFLSSVGYAAPLPADVMRIQRETSSGVLRDSLAIQQESKSEKALVNNTVKQDTLKPDKKAEFVLKKVIIDGLHHLSECDLKPFYANMLGHRITTDDLFDLAADITAHFRNAGYILTRTYVPVQEIENGVVHLKVMEGFVDQILYDWQDMEPNDLIKFYADRLKNVRPLKNDDLERVLLLAKDLPGIKISATLRPSSTTPQASDLVLQVSRKNADISLEVNNDGSPYVGRLREKAAISLNNWLGMNEKLTFFGSHTNPFRRMNTGGGEMLLPIPFLDGTVFDIQADVYQSEPIISVPWMKVFSDATVISVGIKHPLIRTRRMTWFLSGWFDAMGSVSTTKILNFIDDKTFENLRVIRAETSLDFSDEWEGANLITLSIHKGMTGNGAKYFNPDRIAPNLGFTKGAASLSRTQNVGAGVSLYGLLRGQLGATDLPSFQKFNFGGAPFGRAYRSGTLSGDSGFEGKLEVRYTHSLHLLLSSVQFFTYYDYGKTWERRNYLGVPSSNQATGIGFGVRGSCENGLGLRAEYGIPFKKSVSGQKEKDQLYVGINYDTAQ